MLSSCRAVTSERDDRRAKRRRHRPQLATLHESNHLPREVWHRFLAVASADGATSHGAAVRRAIDLYCAQRKDCRGS